MRVGGKGQPSRHGHTAWYRGSRHSHTTRYRGSRHCHIARYRGSRHCHTARYRGVRGGAGQEVWGPDITRRQKQKVGVGFCPLGSCCRRVRRHGVFAMVA